MEKTLFDGLFTTEAVELAPADQPFWYTSGRLGPFYINTHYLFGGRDRADELLMKIEQACLEPTNLVIELMPEILHELEHNQLFRNIMTQAADQLDGLEFEVISGGERRDFFFSLPLAYLMQKPHLTILKDFRTFYQSDVLSLEPAQAEPNLAGKTVIHVADIVTQASSFTRQWLPAIRQANGTIKHAYAILDRHQGGAEALGSEGVSLVTLGDIDGAFFQQAVVSGRIDPAELDLVTTFLHDPAKYMDRFLDNHPDFIDQQLACGGKSQQRAELAIASGYVKSK